MIEQGIQRFFNTAADKILKIMLYQVFIYRLLSFFVTLSSRFFEVHK